MGVRLAADAPEETKTMLQQMTVRLAANMPEEMKSGYSK